MDQIGRFKIVDELGRGTFGMVYKGHDPVINRYAAIKLMSEATAADPSLVARFRREAEAAGQLNHPNIVTIYDLGEEQERPYIAMELLEGIDLERTIKDRLDIRPEVKVGYLVQIAEGLHHANIKGIIHRDIKPANIRVLKDGAVKIMDFGLAHAAAFDLAQTDELVGTLNYMSPERIQVLELDARSDQFAVGAVAYELFSFRRPFPGESVKQVLAKIVEAPPEPLVELHGTDWAWLEPVIFKCLAKSKEERFPDCQALANTLRRHTV